MLTEMMHKICFVQQSEIYYKRIAFCISESQFEIEGCDVNFQELVPPVSIWAEFEWVLFIVFDGFCAMLCGLYNGPLNERSTYCLLERNRVVDWIAAHSMLATCFQGCAVCTQCSGEFTDFAKVSMGLIYICILRLGCENEYRWSSGFKWQGSPSVHSGKISFSNCCDAG